MLDLGFPVGTRGGDDGGTALHTAAYAGSADVARLLLDRGADIEARDTTWDSTPLTGVPDRDTTARSAQLMPDSASRGEPARGGKPEYGDDHPGGQSR
jgi:ankyrin repeat protein